MRYHSTTAHVATDGRRFLLRPNGCLLSLPDLAEIEHRLAIKRDGMRMSLRQERNARRYGRIDAWEELGAGQFRRVEAYSHRLYCWAAYRGAQAALADARRLHATFAEIGRASCRERV